MITIIVTTYLEYMLYIFIYIYQVIYHFVINKSVQNHRVHSKISTSTYFFLTYSTDLK
jgi:hypothetical protein